jgi:hypothetical protein
MTLVEVIERFHDDVEITPATVGELLLEHARRFRQRAEACDALYAELGHEVLSMPVELLDRITQE